MAKPVIHKCCNKVLAPPPDWKHPSGQDCTPLHVYCDGKECVSRWQMTWRERLSALFFGQVWLTVVSGPSQPPVGISVYRNFLKPPA